MFRGTLHDTFFLTVLDTFSYTFTVRRLLLRCPILRRVHPLPLCKEGYVLGRLAEQSLSQVMSPCLSPKSASEHTSIK